MSSKQPLIVAVAGGPSSGKSAVCNMIVDALGVGERGSVALLDQSSFYRPKSVADRERASRGLFNFDDPDALDFKSLESALLDLRKGVSVNVPVYDMHAREITTNIESIPACSVILVEGTLLLFSKVIRELLDIKLFVDVDADVRLSRRVIRDADIYGRLVDSILREYIRFVKPSFEDFILPTKKQADIILPRGEENQRAIGLIAEHIRDWISNDTVTQLYRPRSQVISDMLYSVRFPMRTVVDFDSSDRLDAGAVSDQFEAILN